MKAKYLFTAIILWATLYITSCEYSKLDTYSGKEEVYFSFADTTAYYVIDSITIQLGYDEPLKVDSTISVTAKIMGFVVDYDRPIDFMLVDTLSTAILNEDLELLTDKSFIFAGSSYGNIKVKLKNTTKLSNSTLLATIRMKENDYFYADYVSTTGTSTKNKANEYRIFFTAKNEMPNLWSDQLSRFTTYFGGYSNVKLAFMCEALGFTRDYFTYDPLTENATEVFNVRINPFRTIWPTIFNRKLNQYEEENGSRLIDENGEVVTFPGSTN